MIHQTLLTEYDGFAVGDTVKLIKHGQFYCEHEEWLDYYGLDKTRYEKYDSALLKSTVENGVKGTILAIGKNLPNEPDYLKDDMLFYIDFGEQNLIVSIDGLKLIKKKETKNYCTISDNGKKHFYIFE